MNWLTNNIKWIMLVSGVITCSMIQASFAPQAALTSMFGDTIEGPIAEIVVRNWGALIALVGAMLIYGAFQPQSRGLILTIGIVSKLIFIALVLSFGQQYLSAQAGLAVAFDSIVIILFFLYLISHPRAAQT